MSGQFRYEGTRLHLNERFIAQYHTTWAFMDVAWVRKFAEICMAVILVIGIFILWFNWYKFGPFLAQLRSPANEQMVTRAAAVGDAFGPLNALFAALGFAAVLATLLLQRRDLARQQAQIKEAQDEQQRQRFESSFFQLLGLLREERSSLRYRYSDAYNEAVNPRHRSGDTKIGTMAIRAAILESRFWVRQRNQHQRIVPRDELLELYRRNVHSRYESSLGPYFRLIYTILRRTRDAEFLTGKERAQYGNLLRSQLTSHEVALAGLNGLAPFSNDFPDLLTEFRLLKYLPEGTMKRTLKQHYPKTAFEPRD